MRILAIDPSLCQTGICFPDQQTLVLNPPKHACTGPARLGWIRDQISGIITGNAMTGVVIEDYPLGVKGSSVVQLAELGGVLRLLLHELQVAVAFVNPMHLKLWATGNAKSKKDAVVSSVTLASGRLFDNNDLADAWALGAMAAQARGQPWVPMPADRAKVLTKIHWPQAFKVKGKAE